MKPHDRTRIRRLCRTWTLAPWLLALGCAPSPTDEEAPDFSRLVPVSGTVKIDGKPRAGVVITFLPPRWSASNGETNADGVYSLQTARKPGAFPGEYKVAISYLVSAEGEPQGLGPRSSISPPPGLASAKEQLRPEVSDLGRTSLKATIPSSGGSIDFEVDSTGSAAKPD